MDNKDKFLKAKKRKVGVSLTLDEELVERLVKFRDENGLKELAPMINEMLKDWMDNEDKRSEK